MQLKDFNDDKLVTCARAGDHIAMSDIWQGIMLGNREQG